MNPGLAVKLCYLSMLALQVAWHALLPPPAGSANWLLALIACLPLLLPMRGILRGQVRSMTWGGYLLVLYFVIGVMEAWSNPQQRLPAMAQIALALAYFTSLVWLTRQSRPPRH